MKFSNVGLLVKDCKKCFRFYAFDSGVDRKQNCTYIKN
jgi:hypothetical protein